MSLLETDDEQKYVDWCTEEKIICEKVKFQTAGYPDRLSVLPGGLHVWIEFKRLKKKLVVNGRQWYRVSTLRSMGCLAGWTDDSNIAICCVKAIMDAARLSKESYPFVFEPGRWGAFSGPWFGEDVNLLGCYQNLKAAGSIEESPYSRAVEGRLQGLAGRNL